MKQNLLMIPGPVELDDRVLEALGRPPFGHTSSEFIEIFGTCLDGLKSVFAAPDGQPFVIAGSGTLAMEIAVANVVEPGDRAIVIDTGYFSHRMADVVRRHGAEVEIVSGPLGEVPEFSKVESALAKGAKLMTITHVDTSTGILAPVKELAALGHRYGALVLVDGVCAVAGQEFRQMEWDVDLCLTASQKALAAPSGLALVMARSRALDAFRARKHPVASYYADWTLWLPVMEAYQARKPAYFATPPINLVYALTESVHQINAEGMEARWARHNRLSASFKAGIATLGMKQIPVREEYQAATLTTMYFPDGVDKTLIGRIAAAGVTVAGGLISPVAAQYFRVGHMGVDGIGEILRTLSAIEQGLGVHTGAGVAAAQTRWLKG
jgi:alanine-glyoxylate transaminase / serine-glyoxylate transaminase / serine-pyruvate transaminase